LEGLEPLVRPIIPGKTLEERFQAFHEANPHVFDLLKDMALAIKATGVRRYGMKGLFEILRWQSAVQTEGDEPYKLNNVFTALYARKLMEEVPELNGFFEVRQRQSGKEVV
jgi:hypothetical protein